MRSLTRGYPPFLLALVVATWVTGPVAGAGAFRVLQLDDIKLDWSGHGEEELPTWISGQLSVGPDGRLSGRVVETALSDDGTDEDGDPAGFDSYVFDTDDGTMKDLHFDAHGFSFSASDPTDKDWTLSVAGHLSDPATGAWVVSAASKGAKEASVAQNRFPLEGDSKDGVVSVYPQPQDDGSGPGIEL